ncbi:hypothetical protein AQS8620_01320 [Aquimixticola soesokkakensis]|uniref:Uncharacterized protein n=1 Tax=Aquimixticola soesokkakensis TaxID=1519096 RepID=A0A1Y5SCE9_9RHOB|nr:hypothetical protein AQS8620_01320 [Aquimixticola soesokkakensis]
MTFLKLPHPEWSTALCSSSRGVVGIGRAGEGIAPARFQFPHLRGRCLAKSSGEFPHA